MFWLGEVLFVLLLVAGVCEGALGIRVGRFVVGMFVGRGVGSGTATHCPCPLQTSGYC